MPEKKVKPPWEMSYEEIYKAWYERHPHMSESEARNLHRKWMRLGILAKQGRL